MRSTAILVEGTETRSPAGHVRLTSAGLTWIGVALLLGVIGWYKSLNLVLILAYIMAVLLILNGILARAHVRHIETRRIPVSPVFAGEETRLTVRVRNAGASAATIGVHDALSSPGDWFVERLAALDTLACSIFQTFPSRGRFAVEQPRVWSEFPFGFVRYERPGATRDADLIVLPAIGSADFEGLRRWLMRQASGDGRTRKVLRRVTSEQADVRGVRPFRPGDSLRSVHWRSTARRRELLVCEYDTAPSPELYVVVEPWLPIHSTERDRANLESQLSLAATVVLGWARTFSTKVTLAIASDRQPAIWSASGSDEHIRETLAPLADLQGTPNTAAPDATAFDRSIVTAARVLITTRRGTPMLVALARAAGRPFVVIEPGQRLPWYHAPA